MNTDPDKAALDEPFAFEEAPGVWLAGRWDLIPKLGPTEGWWFPFWWEGPGTRCWRHAGDRAPESAARFPSPAAVAALAADEADSQARR